MSESVPVEPRSCVRCGVASTPGYIPDHTHGGITSSSWVKGRRVLNWFGGVKFKRGLALVAYRCPQCGGVELIAPYTPDKPSA